MTAKTMIKDYALTKDSTAEIFTAVNARLCEGNEAGMFATAWIGIVDTRTGKLQYTNAGHNYPVLLRRGLPCEEKKQWIYDPAELFPTDDSRLDSPRHDGGAAVYFGSRKISRKGISPIGLIGIPAAAGIVAYEIKG